MNLIHAFILFAFFYIHKLKINLLENFFLLLILATCLITELLSKILQYKNHDISLLYSLSFMLHNSFWIYILSMNTIKNNAIFFVSIYVTLSILNMFFIEGFNNTNFNIFILGSVFYLTLFIFSCSKNLREENLSFFLSNKFILLSSPIIFFIGLSIIFSFKKSPLASIVILNNFQLYDIFIYFVNLIYYSLIILYMYKEQKVNGF